jgi:hypothetical protein
MGENLVTIPHHSRALRLASDWEVAVDGGQLALPAGAAAWLQHRD